MKTIFTFTVGLLLAGIAHAQDINHPQPKNKTTETETQSTAMATDAGTLDRLQRETEDISVMKPILFLATIIDERLALRRLEKESIASAKSRETGSK